MRLLMVLQDLSIHLSSPPVLHCDNISTIAFTVNLVFHARTKHIVGFHFVQEKAQCRELIIQFVPSEYHLADLFTKVPLGFHF